MWLDWAIPSNISVYVHTDFLHTIPLSLLLQLVESEMVAKNTKARCEGQGTPYYRFSPKLAETVATGETDNGILINMLIATIVQTIPQLDSIHQQFLRIAEANQKDRFRKRREL